MRLSVDSDGSIAATTFSLIWLSRSEIVSPAASETSAIEVARSRLIFTAESAPMSARWPWAMAQIEALSLAPLTLRPELIRFWTCSICSLVLFRF